MVKLRILAALLFLVGLWLILTAPVSGNHQGPLLPLVPQTPLMQTIQRTQSHTWCVNSTAESYPGFIDQLRDVYAEYEARTGIHNQQVAFGPGCLVQHNFIVGLECGGCAGQIFYANNPVEIQYKADLGYTDWRTTSGHELGHGLLGLHEQYDDVHFICLTDRTWTVMSCGTGVKYPQAFDVQNGCAALATSWCGQAPIVCEPYGGCWHPDIQRWVWVRDDAPTIWVYDPGLPGINNGWVCTKRCP